MILEIVMSNYMFQPVRAKAARDNVLALAIASVLLGVGTASALEVEGFTEPERRIKVAAEEMGVVSRIHVKEGQAVQQGQLLASLRSEVLKAQLMVAKQELQSIGKIESARAEVALRNARLEKLESLRARGFAREEEVQRARADKAIAQARLKTAQEEKAIKQVELKKIEAQLNRRQVRAAMAGVVTIVKKESGEFVAPNDPIVMELVQLKSIFARFSIPGPDARKVQVGQTVKIKVGLNKQVVSGTVEFVSPVIEADSGTVRIKIRVDNSNGAFRSGEKCYWEAQ